MFWCEIFWVIRPAGQGANLNETSGWVLAARNNSTFYHKAQPLETGIVPNPAMAGLTRFPHG